MTVGSVWRGRGPTVFAVVAAALAAVIAATALVVVLASRRGEPGSQSGVPTLGGPQPTDVRLHDAGATITVSWRDPTDGTVSFLVTGGHPGEQLGVMGRLGPGQNELELHGLSTTLDYCFAVVAVYAVNQLASSTQACTSRGVGRSSSPARRSAPPSASN
jgi:hypothetical protein